MFRSFSILLVLLSILSFSTTSAHKILLRRHSFLSTTRPGHENLVKRASAEEPRMIRRTIENDLLFSSSSILAPLEVGTPPQNLFVLLDTASADLAVFGADYADQYSDGSASTTNDESKIGPSFDSGASTSYQSKGTKFKNNYGSGSSATSFTALYSTDTISFRDMTLVNQPVGVIHSGNVTYGPAASGIMGLAFEAASLGLRATPPVQQLLFSKALKAPVFSFALMRPSVAAEQTSTSGITQPGGIFTLGQIDSDQYQGPIGWSSVVSTTQGSDIPHKWLAMLDSVSVNGNVVPDSQGIVANFDTGSSVSRGSVQLIDAILAQIQNVYKDDSGNYYVPCGENMPPAFNMTISMGGVSIPIEPMDMLFKTAQFNINGGTYCFSTLTPTSSDEYDIQIGDDVMRSLYVAFSFNPPKIGIAAQSTNVHNQGAVPSYDFTKTRTLDMSSLSQPQATGFSKVQCTPVPATATDHVSMVGSTSIAVGGTYMPTSNVGLSMETVRPSMIPTQIGPVVSAAATNAATDGIERNPSTVKGIQAIDNSPKSTSFASSASARMSTSAASSWTFTPIIICMVVLPALFIL
ncbi:acid protease [Meira miltonrushii]|uniref:Acid protease n=1 Tax=Meira miltonrushii TaxID=1280837 RepID=A0A316V6W3_9BASI|nr:acid protease [Meira miltonrushii]PWN33266.1 acid protease [Meira miltonrushii]